MIVQFFRYGNGMSKGPLNYLLGKDRKRDHAVIPPFLIELMSRKTKALIVV